MGTPEIVTWTAESFYNYALSAAAVIQSIRVAVPRAGMNCPERQPRA